MNSRFQSLFIHMKDVRIGDGFQKSKSTMRVHSSCKLWSKKKKTNWLNLLVHFGNEHSEALLCRRPGQEEQACRMSGWKWTIRATGEIFGQLSTPHVNQSLASLQQKIIGKKCICISSHCQKMSPSTMKTNAWATVVSSHHFL